MANYFLKWKSHLVVLHARNCTLMRHSQPTLNYWRTKLVTISFILTCWYWKILHKINDISGSVNSIFVICQTCLIWLPEHITRTSGHIPNKPTPSPSWAPAMSPRNLNKVRVTYKHQHIVQNGMHKVEVCTMVTNWPALLKVCSQMWAFTAFPHMFELFIYIFPRYNLNKVCSARYVRIGALSEYWERKKGRKNPSKG
jgi:hypothetical protein